jgi:hypothetical protein
MAMRFNVALSEKVKVSAFTFAGAYLLAALYILVLQLTIPPTDLAYGKPLRDSFEDPFVRTVSFRIASICAALVLPLTLVCLKGRGWFRKGLISIGCVAGFVIIVTPFSPALGALGTPVVAAVSLLTTRFSPGAGT